MNYTSTQLPLLPVQTNHGLFAVDSPRIHCCAKCNLPSQQVKGFIQTKAKLQGNREELLGSKLSHKSNPRISETPSMTVCVLQSLLMIQFLTRGTCHSVLPVQTVRLWQAYSNLF